MTSPEPPKALCRPVFATLHGQSRVDEYAWLRDENWREVMRRPEALRAEVRRHLEAENAYTAGYLAGTEAAQQALVEEMKGRIKADDSSVPAQDGEFAYYQRFEGSNQHPIFCRRSTSSAGREEVLLDANREAGDSPFFQVAAGEHSPDHARFAYAVDDQGSELHTVVVRDARTGERIDEAVRDAAGPFAWTNDSTAILYVALDDHHRPARVLRHCIGHNREGDELLYEEADPGFFVSLSKTQSRRFFVLDAHDHQTSEARLISADTPLDPPRLLLPREPGVQYDVGDHDGRLFFHTNAEGAEDFRIVSAPLDDASPAVWTDVVPHRSGTLILGMRLLRNHLVWLERVEGLPRIGVRRLSDGDEHFVAFPEEAFDVSLIPGYEFDTNTVRFVYSSLTTPREIYDYNLESRERTLRKHQEIPSGHDPALYESYRLLATAPDGEKVPISLVGRKDTPRDGSAPLVLYGYGAYGAAMPASFAPNRFSLLDRGFLYAIAHVRGGTDRGYRWYREGRLEKKPNTFSDYIAAAEHLISKRYTSAGRIAAFGGSAGGLLVGAVVNLRPDLFGAAVAEVPFVDVLNTMCDGTLPLTPPEWPEWGNPIEDEAAYRTIRSYSPYDNVSAQAYPSMLVTAGLSDPRVTYWEPAKWVARLRERKTDDRPLLLKTNMTAGHAGASGRYSKLAEIAMIYVFLLYVFGRLPLVDACRDR